MVLVFDFIATSSSDLDEFDAFYDQFSEEEGISVALWCIIFVILLLITIWFYITQIAPARATQKQQETEQELEEQVAEKIFKQVTKESSEAKTYLQCGPSTSADSSEDYEIIDGEVRIHHSEVFKEPCDNKHGGLIRRPSMEDMSLIFPGFLPIIVEEEEDLETEEAIEFELRESKTLQNGSDKVENTSNKPSSIWDGGKNVHWDINTQKSLPVIESNGVSSMTDLESKSGKWLNGDMGENILSKKGKSPAKNSQIRYRHTSNGSLADTKESSSKETQLVSHVISYSVETSIQNSLTSEPSGPRWNMQRDTKKVIKTSDQMNGNGDLSTAISGGDLMGDPSNVILDKNTKRDSSELNENSRQASVLCDNYTENANENDNKIYSKTSEIISLRKGINYVNRTAEVLPCQPVESSLENAEKTVNYSSSEGSSESEWSDMSTDEEFSSKLGTMTARNNELEMDLSAQEQNDSRFQSTHAWTFFTMSSESDEDPTKSTSVCNENSHSLVPKIIIDCYEDRNGLEEEILVSERATKTAPRKPLIAEQLNAFETDIDVDDFIMEDEEINDEENELSLYLKRHVSVTDLDKILTLSEENVFGKVNESNGDPIENELSRETDYEKIVHDITSQNSDNVGRIYTETNLDDSFNDDLWKINSVERMRNLETSLEKRELSGERSQPRNDRVIYGSKKETIVPSRNLNEEGGVLLNRDPPRQDKSEFESSEAKNKEDIPINKTQKITIKVVTTKVINDGICVTQGQPLEVLNREKPQKDFAEVETYNSWNKMSKIDHTVCEDNSGDNSQGYVPQDVEIAGSIIEEKVTQLEDMPPAVTLGNSFVTEGQSQQEERLSSVTQADTFVTDVTPTEEDSAGVLPNDATAAKKVQLPKVTQSPVTEVNQLEEVSSTVTQPKAQVTGVTTLEGVTASITSQDLPVMHVTKEKMEPFAVTPSDSPVIDVTQVSEVSPSVINDASEEKTALSPPDEQVTQLKVTQPDVPVTLVEDVTPTADTQVMDVRQVEQMSLVVTQPLDSVTADVTQSEELSPTVTPSDQPAIHVDNIINVTQENVLAVRLSDNLVTHVNEVSSAVTSSDISVTDITQEREELPTDNLSDVSVTEVTQVKVVSSDVTLPDTEVTQVREELTLGHLSDTTATDVTQFIEVPSDVMLPDTSVMDITQVNDASSAVTLSDTSVTGVTQVCEDKALHGVTLSGPSVTDVTLVNEATPAVALSDTSDTDVTQVKKHELQDPTVPEVTKSEDIVAPFWAEEILPCNSNVGAMKIEEASVAIMLNRSATDVTRVQEPSSSVILSDPAKADVTQAETSTSVVMQAVALPEAPALSVVTQGQGVSNIVTVLESTTVSGTRYESASVTTTNVLTTFKAQEMHLALRRTTAPAVCAPVVTSPETVADALPIAEVSAATMLDSKATDVTQEEASSSVILADPGKADVTHAQMTTPAVTQAVVLPDAPAVSVVTQSQGVSNIVTVLESAADSSTRYESASVTTINVLASNKEKETHHAVRIPTVCQPEVTSPETVTPVDAIPKVTPLEPEVSEAPVVTRLEPEVSLSAGTPETSSSATVEHEETLLEKETVSHVTQEDVAPVVTPTEPNMDDAVAQSKVTPTTVTPSETQVVEEAMTVTLSRMSHDTDVTQHVDEVHNDSVSGSVPAEIDVTHVEPIKLSQVTQIQDMASVVTDITQPDAVTPPEPKPLVNGECDKESLVEEKALSPIEEKASVIETPGEEKAPSVTKATRAVYSWGVAHSSETSDTSTVPDVLNFQRDRSKLPDVTLASGQHHTEAVPSVTVTQRSEVDEESVVPTVKQSDVVISWENEECEEGELLPAISPSIAPASSDVVLEQLFPSLIVLPKTHPDVKRGFIVEETVQPVFREKSNLFNELDFWCEKQESSVTRVCDAEIPTNVTVTQRVFYGDEEPIVPTVMKSTRTFRWENEELDDVELEVADTTLKAGLSTDDTLFENIFPSISPQNLSTETIIGKSDPVIEEEILPVAKENKNTSREKRVPYGVSTANRGTGLQGSASWKREKVLEKTSVGASKDSSRADHSLADGNTEPFVPDHARAGKEPVTRDNREHTIHEALRSQPPEKKTEQSELKENNTNLPLSEPVTQYQTYKSVTKFVTQPRETKSSESSENFEECQLLSEAEMEIRSILKSGAKYEVTQHEKAYVVERTRESDLSSPTRFTVRQAKSSEELRSIGRRKELEDNEREGKSDIPLASSQALNINTAGLLEAQINGTKVLQSRDQESTFVARVTVDENFGRRRRITILNVHKRSPGSARWKSLNALDDKARFEDSSGEFPEKLERPRKRVLSPDGERNGTIFAVTGLSPTPLSDAEYREREEQSKKPYSAKSPPRTEIPTAKSVERKDIIPHQESETFIIAKVMGTSTCTEKYDENLPIRVEPELSVGSQSSTTTSPSTEDSKRKAHLNKSARNSTRQEGEHDNKTSTRASRTSPSNLEGTTRRISKFDRSDPRRKSKERVFAVCRSPPVENERPSSISPPSLSANSADSSPRFDRSDPQKQSQERIFEISGKAPREEVASVTPPSISPPSVQSSAGSSPRFDRSDPRRRSQERMFALTKTASEEKIERVTPSSISPPVVHSSAENSPRFDRSNPKRRSQERMFALTKTASEEKIERITPSSISPSVVHSSAENSPRFDRSDPRRRSKERMFALTKTPSEEKVERVTPSSTSPPVQSSADNSPRFDRSDPRRKSKERIFAISKSRAQDKDSEERPISASPPSLQSSTESIPRFDRSDSLRKSKERIFVISRTPTREIADRVTPSSSSPTSCHSEDQSPEFDRADSRRKTKSQEITSSIRKVSSEENPCDVDHDRPEQADSKRSKEKESPTKYPEPERRPPTSPLNDDRASRSNTKLDRNDPTRQSKERIFAISRSRTPSVDKGDTSRPSSISPPGIQESSSKFDRTDPRRKSTERIFVVSKTPPVDIDQEGKENASQRKQRARSPSSPTKKAVLDNEDKEIAYRKRSGENQAPPPRSYGTEASNTSEDRERAKGRESHPSDRGRRVESSNKDSRKFSPERPSHTSQRPSHTSQRPSHTSQRPFSSGDQSLRQDRGRARSPPTRERNQSSSLRDREEKEKFQRTTAGSSYSLPRGFRSETSSRHETERAKSPTSKSERGRSPPVSYKDASRRASSENVYHSLPRDFRSDEIKSRSQKGGRSPPSAGDRERHPHPGLDHEQGEKYRAHGRSSAEKLPRSPPRSSRFREAVEREGRSSRSPLSTERRIDTSSFTHREEGKERADRRPSGESSHFPTRPTHETRVGKEDERERYGTDKQGTSVKEKEHENSSRTREQQRWTSTDRVEERSEYRQELTHEEGRRLHESEKRREYREREPAARNDARSSRPEERRTTGQHSGKLTNEDSEERPASLRQTSPKRDARKDWRGRDHQTRKDHSQDSHEYKDRPRDSYKDLRNNDPREVRHHLRDDPKDKKDGFRDSRDVRDHLRDSHKESSDFSRATRNYTRIDYRDSRETSRKESRSPTDPYTIARATANYYERVAMDKRGKEVGKEMYRKEKHDYDLSGASRTKPSRSLDDIPDPTKDVDTPSTDKPPKMSDKAKSPSPTTKKVQPKKAERDERPQDDRHRVTAQSNVITHSSAVTHSSVARYSAPKDKQYTESDIDLYSGEEDLEIVREASVMVTDLDALLGAGIATVAPPGINTNDVVAAEKEPPRRIVTSRSVVAEKTTTTTVATNTQVTSSKETSEWKRYGMDSRKMDLEGSSGVQETDLDAIFGYENRASQQIKTTREENKKERDTRTEDRTGHVVKTAEYFMKAANTEVQTAPLAIRPVDVQPYSMVISAKSSKEPRAVKSTSSDIIRPVAFFSAKTAFSRDEPAITADVTAELQNEPAITAFSINDGLEDEELDDVFTKDSYASNDQAVSSYRVPLHSSDADSETSSVNSLPLKPRSRHSRASLEAHITTGRPVRLSESSSESSVTPALVDSEVGPFHPVKGKTSTPKESTLHTTKHEGFILLASRQTATESGRYVTSHVTAEGNDLLDDSPEGAPQSKVRAVSETHLVSTTSYRSSAFTPVKTEGRKLKPKKMADSDEERRTVMFDEDCDIIPDAEAATFKEMSESHKSMPNLHKTNTYEDDERRRATRVPYHARLSAHTRLWLSQTAGIDTADICSQNDSIGSEIFLFPSNRFQPGKSVDASFLSIISDDDEPDDISTRPSSPMSEFSFAGETPLYGRTQGGITLVICGNSYCRQEEVIYGKERTSFTSCPACYTYYCTRECRRAHWREHKKVCYYGRINSYIRSFIYFCHKKDNLRLLLSKIATTKLEKKGRGCVMVTFGSPQCARKFMTSGCVLLPSPPSYSTISEVKNEGVVSKHKVALLQLLKDYNPDEELVLNLAIVAGRLSDLPTQPVPRQKSSTVLQCVKIPLSETLAKPRTGPAFPDTSEETKVFYLPKCARHDFVNEMEARRHYCRIISKGLKEFGIRMRRDYPDAYNKLCRYVEKNVPFEPLVVYGSKGTRIVKCKIMPEGYDSDIDKKR